MIACALRRMTPDDAGDLIAAFDAMLPDDWRDGPLPDAARMTEVLSDECVIVITAFDKKAPAGYVSGFILPALNRNGSVVMLDDLLVAEGYRNQGLGRRLVEAFKDAAKGVATAPIAMWSGTGVDNIACQKAFIGAGGKAVDEAYTEFEWKRLD
ncbi:MAG: GNAT family N-acetyltransferase [Pseudomonadota bacterium]